MYRVITQKQEDGPSEGERDRNLPFKMKTTKGGKVMNPTDAYRKEPRKKELKRVITFNIVLKFFFCQYLLVCYRKFVVELIPYCCPSL